MAWGVDDVDAAVAEEVNGMGESSEGFPDMPRLLLCGRRASLQRRRKFCRPVLGQQIRIEYILRIMRWRAILE